jgi:Spy/CpxP family protein refolding chaperone
MKRSHALVLATALAVSAAVAANASASSSGLAGHMAGAQMSVLSRGGERGDGGALPGGGIAHGSIGKAAPSANAASRIRALGGNE